MFKTVITTQIIWSRLKNDRSFQSMLNAQSTPNNFNNKNKNVNGNL